MLSRKRARFLEYGGIYGVWIFLLHAGAIGLVLPLLSAVPELGALCLVAYGLGLRHAFDADHIAAIDNSVRAMVRPRKRPQGSGFYFSLGHSFVVVLLSIGVAVSAEWVKQHLSGMEGWGSIVGPTVAGSFLVLIAIINIKPLRHAIVTFRQASKPRRLLVAPGAAVTPPHPHGHSHSQGLLYRLFRPLFSMATKSWHLFPLGLLFGLGFDTASTVALMGLSLQSAHDVLPWNAILGLPLFFTAGMTLLDTTNGVIMTRAYKISFSAPRKRALYNVVATAASVILALVIGATTLAQVGIAAFSIQGTVSEFLGSIDFGVLGLGVFVLFALVVGLTGMVRLVQRARIRTGSLS